MDELKRLQQENQILREEIKQIKQESTQYLQNVAHQLTAPLGAIKWGIEGLKTTAKIPIEKRKRLLSSVYSQATILVHLIKNFTLMSNLEADHELGQFREQPESVDLLRLSINLANDFQPQARETDKDIIVVDDSFIRMKHGKTVNIVKNLVAQAISNILENAVKYAHKGSTIKIGGVEDDMTGVFVLSKGIPISEKEQGQLFARNFRGEAARQLVPAGTGLGLYLVERIMSIHTGNIKLKIQGDESVFILLFPRSSSH